MIQYLPTRAPAENSRTNQSSNILKLNFPPIPGNIPKRKRTNNSFYSYEIQNIPQLKLPKCHNNLSKLIKMTDDVSAEVIKKTQETLGKYIKKPPLTEKLLKKPPFRFLHDIVTNVIHDTGFLNGLYNENEMSSENIKDRDAKIAFLEKLINALSAFCICNCLTFF